MTNKPIDLIWIIPQIFGELFLTVFIPLVLLKNLVKIGIFSLDGLVYIALVYLLLTQLKLKGLKNIEYINWKKIK